MLSKILAEKKIYAKGLNYFESKLTNVSKTKIFFINKYTKHALQNYKTDLLLFFVKLCKNSSLCVLLRVGHFYDNNLPQEGKMWIFTGY